MSEGRDTLTGDDAFNGQDFGAFRQSKEVFGSDLLLPSAFGDFSSMDGRAQDAQSYFAADDDSKFWGEVETDEREEGAGDIARDVNDWEDEAKFNELVSDVMQLVFVLVAVPV